MSTRCGDLDPGVAAWLARSEALTAEGFFAVANTGGSGENAGAVRSRICEGLGFLGIDLDESANQAHVDIVSAPASRVTVHVIRTDEELMIAKSVARALHLLD